MLPQVRPLRLPRMADFALWATACESAFRPPGTLETAYSNSRRHAIESIVEADPVAARVREIMADRAKWIGSASELLQAGTTVAGSGWPKSPPGRAQRLALFGPPPLIEGEDTAAYDQPDAGVSMDALHGAGRLLDRAQVRNFAVPLALSCIALLLLQPLPRAMDFVTKAY
jgi:hypothetical protein